MGTANNSQPSIRVGRPVFRRLLILVVMAVVLIIGGLTAYQHVLSVHLQSQLQLWTERARAEGWSVSFGTPARTGWPQAATLEVPDFALSASGDGAPVWHCDRLLLTVDLFRPDHLTIAATGQQQVGTVGRPLHDFSAHTLTVNLPFRPEHGTSLATLTAERLRAPEPEITIEDLTLSVLQLRPELQARVVLNGLELPGSQSWPLGSRVAHLDGVQTLTHPPATPASIPVIVRSWQAAGGELQISQTNLRWGPLDAVLTGAAHLDAALQPAAAGQALLTGYDQALDVLASRHVMSNDAAFAAKAVLSLLAQTPAGGGSPTVAAPFSLRDLVLYIGPIPLARVRPITWDGS